MSAQMCCNSKNKLRRTDKINPYRWVSLAGPQWCFSAHGMSSWMWMSNVKDAASAQVLCTERLPTSWLHKIKPATSSCAAHTATGIGITVTNSSLMHCLCFSNMVMSDSGHTWSNFSLSQAKISDFINFVLQVAE